MKKQSGHTMGPSHLTAENFPNQLYLCEHSTPATVWWYHIQSLQVKHLQRQLSKLPALFTMLPRSSALVIHLSTRNARVHNNHTTHTTLHLYFITCQFYSYCSHSQFVCTSCSVSSFQLHPKIKRTTICSHDSYGANHAATRTQCLTETAVHRFFHVNSQ